MTHALRIKAGKYGNQQLIVQITEVIEETYSKEIVHENIAEQIDLILQCIRASSEGSFGVQF